MRILIIILTLFSCKPGHEIEQSNYPNGYITLIGQSIKYVKDTRTNLCFAYIYVTDNSGFDYGTGGPGLATVPCDAVAKYISSNSQEIE